MHLIALAAVIMNPISLACAQPPRGATPVPFERVTITDSFWSARQRANATGTLQANFTQCEKTGRIENFVKAARGEGTYEGYFFNDSDVYKAIEGACYVLKQHPDAGLDTALDALIAKIAAAQQPDGYLNAHFTLMEPQNRWKDLGQKHEMYCAGHLIEAGIAHHQATGKRTLLEVATRFADHIDSVFGPPPKRNGVCGHEEIELALFKLWKHTGEARYRDLAQYFLDQRGRSGQVGAAPGQGEHRALLGEYCQDHAPLRDQQHVVGHAVRAMYYYCAATDRAILTGDDADLRALERIWDDLTQTKMYITGGIGNSASNEGFTSAYDLPNDSAYAETCAGIGLVLWGHRMAMLHAHQGARYMDTVERGLYNGVLSGVSLDGKLFFYENPLGSRGDRRRREWYACACCPPNVLRLVAQVGGMVYAQAPGSLFVNLFVGSSATTTLACDDGEIKLGIEQTTQYPWEGATRIRLSPERQSTFTVYVRVPGWCRSMQARVNDEPVEGKVTDGYVALSRSWNPGDTIECTMAMPIERIRSHPSVKGNVGRVALQRGPIVYCFEGVDNPDLKVRQAAIPAGAEMHADHRPSLLGGVTVLRVKGQSPEPAGPQLYRPSEAATITLTAVPYYAWENREPGEMLVWMPETLGLADRPADPSITASASHCWRADSLLAMYDGLEPANSADHALPRMTFWPRKGTTEWVQYELAAPRTVRGVSVYWFDDSGTGGGCALPASWRVLVRTGAEWKVVASDGPIVKDAPGIVQFPPLSANAVKLEITLQGGTDARSAGILEWKLLD